MLELNILTLCMVLPSVVTSIVTGAEKFPVDLLPYFRAPSILNEMGDNGGNS